MLSDQAQCPHPSPPAFSSAFCAFDDMLLCGDTPETITGHLVHGGELFCRSSAGDASEVNLTSLSIDHLACHSSPRAQIALLPMQLGTCAEPRHPPAETICTWTCPILVSVGRGPCSRPGRCCTEGEKGVGWDEHSCVQGQDTPGTVWCCHITHTGKRCWMRWTHAEAPCAVAIRCWFMPGPWA